MPHYYTYDSNLTDRNKFTSTVERKLIDDSLVIKRYFSQLDTDVYFGATHIDEMVAIDFTIAEPKLPIYGYNSFYPNRIVSGRRTLQGTFAINFTSTTYLLDILKNIDDSVMANDYEALVFRCPEEDSTGLGIGNSAIFSKMFDITISYGYGKEESKRTYNGCYQTIVGAQIVDYRQALDTEGNPILDMYSFIAKDIRYHDAVNDDDNDDIKSPEDEEKTPEDSPVTDKIVKTGKLFNELIPSEITDKNGGLPSIDVEKEVGFKVKPIIGKDKKNGDYYITLGIDFGSEDFHIDKIENIDVRIDAKNSLNGLEFPLPRPMSVKPGSASTEYLTESYREYGAKLWNAYEKEKGFNVTMHIKFSFTVDNVTVNVDDSVHLIQNK